MASDFSGKAKHVGGKVKEAVGDALGDRHMKRDGKLQQFEGEAEQDMAHAEEKLDEASERHAAARTARKMDK
jgi:uncharacterized protein YjbJ (UPF0337 family)